VAKIGVIHYNLPRFTLDGFIKYAKLAGFDYVELQSRDVWMPDTASPEEEAKKVRKMCDDAGITVSAFAAQNDFVLLDETTIKAQVERMKRICQLALILGTHVIRTEGGAAKDAVPKEKWVDAMAGCLSRCVPFIEKDDVKLAVDNHGYVTNDGDLQIKLFKKVGSKNVGSNLDTMNYRWAGHSLEAISRFYEIIAPHVFHTHMKDGRGCGKEYRGAALGEGEIDLAKAARCLKAAGYQGVYCAEYEGRAEPQEVGYWKCANWLKANI
jgi:sugar phosphate isomerase/epimerase